MNVKLMVAVQAACAAVQCGAITFVLAIIIAKHAWPELVAIAGVSATAGAVMLMMLARLDRQEQP